MSMEKHHSNLIAILGIAMVAGFLLFPPALAGPIYGFPTAESAQSLMLSMHGLAEAPLAVTNETDSVDTPITEEGPEEADFDAFDPYADEEPEELSGIEQNISEPSIALPDNGSPNLAGVYEDEQLDSLISTTSIRLMKLSLRHAHALYLQDTDAAAAAVDELHELSQSALEEAQSLRVSQDREQIQNEFIRSLETHIAVSEALVNAADADAGEVSSLIREIEGASTDLETVQQRVNTAVQATAASGPEMAESPLMQMSTIPVEHSPAKKTLLLQERYRYDDPEGENMVSLIVDSTRNATTYHTVSNSEPEQTVEAGEGQMFLLVVVKATNLGHKGNSDLYTIETPDRSAFTLMYQGSEYAPQDMPHFTSLGESYSQRTLERYASVKGYLCFDVPESMDLSEAKVRTDLGLAGTPVWDIGTGL